MGSERGMKTHQMSLPLPQQRAYAATRVLHVNWGVNKNGKAHRIGSRPFRRGRSVAWSAARTRFVGCFRMRRSERGQRGRGRCIQLRYTRIVRQTDRDDGGGEGCAHTVSLPASGGGEEGAIMRCTQLGGAKEGKGEKGATLLREAAEGQKGRFL